MLKSQQSVLLIKALTVMVFAGFIARHGLETSRGANPLFAGSSAGEFGGDLALLRKWYTPPQSGESNHYIDLWSGTTLPALAHVNGLTNNHALFVDSHGKANSSSRGSSYQYYPNQPLVPPGQKIPSYSARDLAAIIAPEQRSTIHNIVVAGCNAEGQFRSDELRRYFPNATNITHMAAGALGFKPMYYQAIVLPSSEIRALYGKAAARKRNDLEYKITLTPSDDTTLLGSYVADLYLPSARQPYRTVRAGRELLEPGAATKSTP